MTTSTKTVCECLDLLLPLIPEDEPMYTELKYMRDNIFMELPENTFSLMQETYKIMQEHITPGGVEDLKQWEHDLCVRWKEYWNPTGQEPAPTPPNRTEQKYPGIHTWIATSIGQEFDLAEPNPKIIHIDDIAQGLSNICRYAGQCNKFYSVAQHSVIVARNVPKELRLPALLHDAAEAYIGDITAPLKRMLGNVWHEIEWSIDVAIAEAFDFSPELFDAPEIELADKRAMMAEVRDLFNHKPNIPPYAEPLEERISPMIPFDARHLFLGELSKYRWESK